MSSSYFKIDSLVIPVGSQSNRLGSDSPWLSSTSSNGTWSSENVPQVHNIHPALDEVPDEANDPEEESNGKTHHLKQIINPQQEGICCRTEYAKLPLHLKRKNNDSIEVSFPVEKQRNVITTSVQNISIVLEKEDNVLPNVTTDDEEEKVQQLVFSDSQTIQAHSHASIAKFEGKQCLSNANTPHCREPSTSVILVDENSPDPETWLNINNYTSGTKVTLYRVSKNNILNKKKGG